MDENKTQKPGRPTKWTPEMNLEIVKYFDIEPTREVVVTKTDKKGNEFETTEERANPMPTFEGFAASIDVDDDTIVEWAKAENKAKYPGFSAAYKKAKHLQKKILVTNGLLGHYSTAFAIFTAKNVTNMRDVAEQRQIDGDGKDVQPQQIVINVVKPK